MYQYNYRALKTLKAMNLTKQATKSIRGQLLAMTDSECEAYLKKIIANAGAKKRRTRDEVVPYRGAENPKRAEQLN